MPVVDISEYRNLAE